MKPTTARLPLRRKWQWFVKVLVALTCACALVSPDGFFNADAAVTILSLSASDLVNDPGTDRIYATVPAAAAVHSNTVMRLNPYSAAVEAYIPLDTNPGLMALSASNQYVYIAVQSGFAVQRLNLATQLPDFEFLMPTNFPNFYAVNLVGLPDNPQSVAIDGLSGYGPSQNFIFDDGIAKTNLADLALVPGLDNYGILTGGILYLPGGSALNPTNLNPVGVFQVLGVVPTGPVAPDPASGSVFFLTQQGGTAAIYAYSSATYTLQGSQAIPGVIGTAQNLVRWGTNGLAFCTTSNQLCLIGSPLLPGPAAAQLAISQAGPALATVGSTASFTITITNAGTVAAADVVLKDPLPPGASFVSAGSTNGAMQFTNGVLTGAFGTLPPNGVITVNLTLLPTATGILRNVATVSTTTADSNMAQETSTWLTSVSNGLSSNQVAQLLLPVNDLVFNAADGKLYASVSGASASFGNSIVAIDPAGLQISNPIPVGSEPGALTLSQDGRYLYVYLQSSATIELFDLRFGTVTVEDSIYSLALTEMFVLPGSESLLFSQHLRNVIPSEAGVQIISDGVARSLTNVSGISLIQPSVVSNVFYGYNGDVPSQLSRVQLVGTNTITASVSGLVPSGEPEFRSGGDLLFFPSGEVIDPEAMIQLAKLPGLSPPPFDPEPSNPISADTDSGRVYYLKMNGSTATIAAYSLNTYQLTGTIQIPGILGAPEQLVRWGTNGLAFATTGEQVFLVQTPIVPTNQPADLVITQAAPGSTVLLTNYVVTVSVTNQGPGVATGVVIYDLLPTSMRFLSASSTQGTFSTNAGALTAVLGTLDAGTGAQVSILLRPEAVASSFNYVRVAANEPDLVMTNNSSLQTISNQFFQNTPLYIGDTVYDPSRGKLFVTVQNAGSFSNSIVQVDPNSGTVDKSLPTGFVPGKIAISSDGQFLYVGTTQQGIVARVSIQAWTNDLTFALGNDPNGIAYIAADFAPLPEQPHSVAVSMHTWYGSYTPKIAIFDDGVSRTNTMVEGGGGTYFIECSPDASTLYVVNADSARGYAIDPLTFSPHPIDASGIGTASTILTNYNADFRIEQNLAFTESGQVLNLQDYTVQGTFPVSGGVAPDLDHGVVYFLVQGGLPAVPTWTLVACSITNSNILWQITVPGATGTAYSVTRCTNGILAFATAPNSQTSYTVAASANQLYFVNTAAVPAAGDLVLGAITNWAFAGGTLTNTFTIFNEGPLTATGVTFTNVLPSGSTFVSAKSSRGSFVQTNGVVVFSVGSMSGGATVTITVVSSVTVAGAIPLQASISKNEPDLDPSNNQVSLTEMIYPTPSVSVGDISVNRQSGALAVFNIALAATNTQPVSLYCTTTNGSARSPGDYFSSSRTVVISPGATNASFSVPILNNGLVESNLVFFLNVSLSPFVAPLVTASCTLLNINFYRISVTNISVEARLSGTTNAVLGIQLSGSYYAPASVNYFTRDGTALSGIDYLGEAGTFVFPPGTTNGSLSIPVYAASGGAPTKTFYLVLTNAVNAVLAVQQATATIVQSNYAPVLNPARPLPDGRFQLTVNGAVSGRTYVLLASTDLVDWTPISGFVTTNPPTTIYDPTAAQYARRFYRLGPPNLAPTIRFGFDTRRPFDSNGFSAVLYGLPGLSYSIDASTDLLNWVPVMNFISTNSPFSFQDPTATNYSRRFYRAVIP